MSARCADALPTDASLSGETYIGGVSPAWSPDGLRIAYLASNLYVYDRTTHTSALVTEGCL